MDQVKIIVIREPVVLSILRDCVTFALFVALIGIGVWLDSAAMQWVGAIIGFMVIALISVKLSKTYKKMTPQEAINHIRTMIE